MHTHLVAVPAWRHRNEGAPVAPMLQRVVNENLVLVSTGGADWLDGTGTAEKVEGGYKVNARKIFCSGGPAGDLLMTTAVTDDAEMPNGKAVLHMAVPLKAEGVQIQDNWRVLGMRGTGSNDITIENVFVPDAAVPARRPQGAWHPLVHTVAMIALPIIYGVYTGVAEAARDLAVEKTKKRDDIGTQLLAGEMENELQMARLGLADMIDAAEHEKPGMETTNRVLRDRALVERGAIGTVEKAMQVMGGGSFFRSVGLERLFRDVQGARFHPMQEMPQRELTGRLALGLRVE
jgi:acyl-CoA dehydrogenase